MQERKFFVLIVILIDVELFKMKRFRNAESPVRKVIQLYFDIDRLQMMKGDYSSLEKPLHCDRHDH